MVYNIVGVYRMPFKEIQTSFSELNYIGLKDMVRSMYAGLHNEEKDDIKIPLKNGKIDMNSGFTIRRTRGRELEFHKYTVNVDIDATEKQIDLLFKNVPKYLEKLQEHSQFSIKGELEREDGRPPLTFSQNISYKELGKFQVAPEFPPELTREIKDLKVDGVEGYDYLNDEKYGLLMRIGREFQKRGFERSGIKTPCQRQVCVMSKKVGPRKLTKNLRESPDNMEFYAERRSSSSKRLSEFFNLSINPNTLQIKGHSESISGTYISGFLGDIITDMKVEVDPDKLIKYDEYYKSEHPHLESFSKKIKNVGGEIKKGLSYLGYATTPFIYLYDKAVVEPREEMRDAANWALAETKTLKSNGMACIRMVDKACMLKKYREAQEKEK